MLQSPWQVAIRVGRAALLGAIAATTLAGCGNEPRSPLAADQSLAIEGAGASWLSGEGDHVAVKADGDDGVSRLRIYTPEGDDVATSPADLDIRTAAWLPAGDALIAVTTTPGEDAPRRTRLVELLLDGDNLRVGKEWDVPGQIVGEISVPAEGSDVYLTIQPRSLTTEESSVVALDLASGEVRTLVQAEPGYIARDPCALRSGDVIFERGAIGTDEASPDGQGLFVVRGDEVVPWLGDAWTLTPRCSADGSVAVFGQYGEEDRERHPPLLRTASTATGPVLDLGPAPVHWSVSSDGAMLSLVGRDGRVRVEELAELRE